MDKELRAELRAFKTEVLDRLDRLEQAARPTRKEPAPAKADPAKADDKK